METGQHSGTGYLPLREAAKWAGISERTLKRWITRGLPRYQAGPRERVLIRVDDIQEFLVKRQAPCRDLKELAQQAFAGLAKKRQQAA